VIPIEPLYNLLENYGLRIVTTKIHIMINHPLVNELTDNQIELLLLMHTDDRFQDYIGKQASNLITQVLQSGGYPISQQSSLQAIRLAWINYKNGD